MKTTSIIVLLTLLITLLCPPLNLLADDIVPLPDTGQILFYNDSENIDEPVPGAAFYGQDANYTRERSFTKLAAAGYDLPDTATSWAMVRDNVTGLIWEVKTNDGSIHDHDKEYGWLQAQSEFIADLNATHFNGYDDWRIPTVIELSQLSDSGRCNPAISLDFFPKTKSSNYWTSTTYAGNTNGAWRLDFTNGNVNSSSKGNDYHVRAVRP